MIELRDVSLGYPSPGGDQGPCVLEGLDLHVREGEFVCVLGPSGCGKTSLLNLVAGFLAARRGQVLHRGQPVRGPGPERAVVFQDPTLFPWLTVRENVAFGLRCRDELPADLEPLLAAALSRVGLEGIGAAQVHELSGGMRQRVALARVLVLDPVTLLMDEPFGALDAPTREHLQDELLGIWEQEHRTVVLVTHSAEEAAYLADRVVLLGPPPTGVRGERVVDLPRPRRRHSPEFGELVAGLRRQLPATPAALGPEDAP